LNSGGSNVFRFKALIQNFFQKNKKKGTKQRIQEYPNFQSASSHVSGLLNQKFKGKKNTLKKGPTILQIA
jgi:RecJ-like exonuclease